ncbi:MAG: alpha/beta hydrolase, partial [Oleibacter sp.]|nr:alpha/beta hydrolase [Thalassolituus sp.]
HYSLNFDALSPVPSHHAGKLVLGGYDIMVQRWIIADAKGTVVIVHGYYDHIGLYRTLIDFCLRQQLNVVAFDLPGHGLSSGEPASISDFQEYDDVFSEIVTHLVQSISVTDTDNDPSAKHPLYAFGQSTGGAILINYLLKRQATVETSPFKDVILLAPLVRPAGWNKGRFLHPVLRYFKQQLKRKPGESSSDLDFLTFVRENDPLQSIYLSVRWVGAMLRWVRFIEAQPSIDHPLLVIQGDQDATVDWRHNLQVIADKFSPSEQWILTGGRHHLVNETESLRAQMYERIAKRLNT